jgi:hypothetical protein
MSGVGMIFPLPRLLIVDKDNIDAICAALAEREMNGDNLAIEKIVEEFISCR